VKSSPKTKGQFVGCSAWPDCDVTYPLPQGKIEPVAEQCPVCGTPQIKVIQFRQAPKTRCLDPACPTNLEASVDVGACPVCAREGRADGRLMSQRSPRTLKRFARCTNYAICGTSYPLPQSGELEPTGEACECGAPIVVAHTKKGPWRVCIDPQCPSKAETDSRNEAGSRRSKRGSRTRESRGASM
ncbi:MAG: topoisomerase DNA-binding C4 zinc finger domain-containing protein, partial [Coriobacteriales bacterium]